MKISVVTPLFNGLPYLIDCIESVKFVLNGLDYEHVIVDGLSTDGSIEVLNKTSNILCKSEKDGGMYEALNKAIELASGEIIIHLNSDEQLNKEGTLDALNKFSDGKVDAVFGPTIMLDGEYKFLQLFKQVVVPKIIDTHWCMPVQSCSLFYRKKIWERYHYNTKFRLVADHDWFRKQMEMGLNIVCSRKPMGIFLWHGNNLSSTEGKVSQENALADINTKSFRIKMAKHWYRFKKLCLGGYLKSPIEYALTIANKNTNYSIKKPSLKLRKIFK